MFTILPPTPKSVLTKFRCSVAPLRVETRLYENAAIEKRLCQMCNTTNVGNELHLLHCCSAYNHIRGE